MTAVYVPKQITDLIGGQELNLSGTLDRPGLFGIQGLPTSLSASAATTALSQTTRIAHAGLTDCTGIRLVYANARWSPAYFATPNPFTLTAAIEINGVNYPVFFQGKRSVVIEPGGWVVSDPISAIYRASYAQIYSRSYQLMTAQGLQYPQCLLATNSGTGVCSIHVDAGANDLTGGTGALDNAGVTGANTIGYAPMMILGRPLNSKRLPICIAVVGDSIASGNADNAAFGFMSGWCERGLLPLGYGVKKVSISSDAFGTGGWGNDANKIIRLGLIENEPYALVQMGINDVAADFTTFQTNYLREWNTLDSLRLKVVQATMGPNPANINTTIGYATAANQIPSSQQYIYSGYENMFVQGTVASAPTVGGNTLVINDASATLNKYQNYSLLMTGTGTAKGRGFTISSSTATSGGQVTLTLASTWAAPLPSVGDAFLISTAGVAKNEWFRQVPAPLIGIVDQAAAVECDSTGNNVVNGRMWYAPKLVSNGIVGSTTHSGTAGTVTDANGARGWVNGNFTAGNQVPFLVFTSGANSGQVARVASITGSVVTYNSSSFSSGASPGDTYQIVNVFGGNGPHPSAAGNAAAAAALAAVAPNLFK